MPALKSCQTEDFPFCLPNIRVYRERRVGACSALPAHLQSNRPETSPPVHDEKVTRQVAQELCSQGFYDPSTFSSLWEQKISDFSQLSLFNTSPVPETLIAQKQSHLFWVLVSVWEEGFCPEGFKFPS